MARIQPKLNAKSPREYRWFRNREKILSASGRLFRQKTFLGTSIQDIANASRVNKATVYYYFENKPTLLFEIATKVIDALADIAMPVADSDLSPKVKLRNLITNHVKWQESHLTLAGIGQREMTHLSPKLLREYVAKRDAYENIFRKIIEDILASEGSTNLDPKLTSLFILGFMNSITYWYKPQGELSVDEIAQRACTFIFGALKAFTVEADCDRI